MNSKQRRRQKKKYLKSQQREKDRKVITKHYRNADAETFIQLARERKMQDAEIEQMNQSFEKDWNDSSVLFEFAVAKNL